MGVDGVDAGHLPGDHPEETHQGFLWLAEERHYISGYIFHRWEPLRWFTGQQVSFVGLLFCLNASV